MNSLAKIRITTGQLRRSGGEMSRADTTGASTGIVLPQKRHELTAACFR